jgi:hypothetical protein
MPTLTNDERSKVEVAAFMQEKPDRYFAYWNARGRWSRPGEPAALIPGDTITTWPGDVLATITWTGEVFASSFSDRRQSFRARGINGVTYSGTAYLTAGDYVRMRAVRA